jgi:hypothetical protein
MHGQQNIKNPPNRSVISKEADMTVAVLFLIVLFDEKLAPVPRHHAWMRTVTPLQMKTCDVLYISALYVSEKCFPVQSE